MSETEQNNNRRYQPVEIHWFWQSPNQNWKPFSRIDSTALENAYQESITFLLTPFNIVNVERCVDNHRLRQQFEYSRLTW